MDINPMDNMENPMDNMENPMDNMENPMDNMENPMDNTENPMDNMENPYDKNFDAGVEADEEDDPKRFIEQLSGKLSQSLRSYQDGLPKPDAETAKYAAGMVVKAAIDGLDNKDVKDILNKLKTDEDDETSEEPQGDEESMEFDGLESVNRYNSMIDEIYIDLTQKKEKENSLDQINKEITYRKKPFTAPKLK